jgi:hypothetical protein
MDFGLVWVRADYQHAVNPAAIGFDKAWDMECRTVSTSLGFK